MRVRLRHIAAGLLFATFLVLHYAPIELGAVPEAHAQRYRSQPILQSPESSGKPMSCSSVGGALLVFMALALTFAGSTNSRKTGADDDATDGAPDGPVDVTVLRVAVDGRERKFLQGQLDGITKNADARSRAGLMRVLREVTVVLRRARESWLYAGIVNAEPMHAPEAAAWFQQHAEDARTRFREALIRNAGGATVTRAGEALAAAEGEGLVVITLIVAARDHLLDFHDLADAEQVRRCLESLGNLTSATLTAVEILWSPAAENQRLGVAELERLYPDVHKIRGSSLAGRIRCASCDGPFPAELVSCPHCGAHVSEQAAS
jgi:uncharacterized membrane protein